MGQGLPGLLQMVSITAACKQKLSGLQDQEAKAARRAAEVKAVAEGGRNRAVAAQQAQREIERLRLEEQRLKLEQVGQGRGHSRGIASMQQLQS